MDSQGCNVSSFRQRRLWSDFANALADLSQKVLFSNCCSFVVSAKLLKWLLLTQWKPTLNAEVIDLSHTCVSLHALIYFWSGGICGHPPKGAGDHQLLQVRKNNKKQQQKKTTTKQNKTKQTKKKKKKKQKQNFIAANADIDARSDVNLLCPLTEDIATVEYINIRLRRLTWAFAIPIRQRKPFSRLVYNSNVYRLYFPHSCCHEMIKY